KLMIDCPGFLDESLRKMGFSERFIRANWLELCLPRSRRLGFGSMFEVSKALFAKLWWNFRIKPSLWSAFMSNKYNKKLNPVIVPWKERLSCLTERNQLLAIIWQNKALEHEYIAVHSFNEIDTQGRKIINGDKLQFSYLRVRAAGEKRDKEKGIATIVVYKEYRYKNGGWGEQYYSILKS
ncbi:hypothetical protein HAX54_032514, partial [Datura stramonium]|nr:hypothetical protein [Datura stramonium]